MTSIRAKQRWWRWLSAVGLVLAVVISLLPTSLEAQVRRGGGRGSAPRGYTAPRGYVAPRIEPYRGWGGGGRYGWWRPGYWVYPDVYATAATNDYVIWPPTTPTIAAPATSLATASGTTGQLVYDATGKPVGVIFQNLDGSLVFVPLTNS